MDYGQESIKLHRKHRGKISVVAKVPLETKDDLSLAYTPGVAAVCSAIGQDKKQSWQLTNRANQVAIVCDGTAILGLGDLGPEAAMPVMEGKAVIFKKFADIDATALCIKTTDVDEIVKFCKDIEPSFGGINLEDISAPRCFEILERLERELEIPVFHDDQDGTAIVVLAALINACRLAGKEFGRLKVVVNGAGAAGLAISRLLISQQVKDLILLDSQGCICEGRCDLNSHKQEIACQTNRGQLRGGLAEALQGADVFIGVSKGGLVSAPMVAAMAPQSIIFALANPEPEVMPEIAKQAGAFIVGTGRSDLPNQINNALVFPGIFRGLLDYRLSQVTLEMKVKAAQAIAASIEPAIDKLLPTVLENKTTAAIVAALKEFKK